MSKFLDSNGLAYFWGKLKAYFVAKEVGKGLSTNDYTTAEKNKLAGIEAGAEVNTVTSVNGQTGAVTVPSVVMSDTAPLMDGTASAGVSDEAARGDHVHPHDISLLPIDTVTGNPVVIDAYPATAEGLSVTFTPKQSGSGDPTPSNIRPITVYTEVSVDRYAKNLLNPLVAYNSIGYNVAVGNTIVPTAAAKQWQDNGDGTFTISSLGSWAQAGLISAPLPLGKAYLKISNIKGGLRVSVYVCNKDLKINRTSLLRNPASEGETIYVDTTFVNDDRYFVIYLSGSGANASITEPYAYSGNTAATDPYVPFIAPASISVQLGQTIYGGTVDITSGECAADWAYVDLGTLGWWYDSTNRFFYANALSNVLIKDKTLTAKDVFVCSAYTCTAVTGSTGDSAQASQPDYTASYHWNGGSAYVYIKDSNYTTASAFKTAMDGVELAYKLAVPIAAGQVTSQQLELLDGINTLTTDTDSLTVSYRCEIQKYIQKLIAALA